MGIDETIGQCGASGLWFGISKSCSLLYAYASGDSQPCKRIERVAIDEEVRTHRRASGARSQGAVEDPIGDIDVEYRSVEEFDEPIAVERRLPVPRRPRYTPPSGPVRRRRFRRLCRIRRPTA